MAKSIVAPQRVHVEIPESLDGARLDVALTALVENRSRSFLQGLIRQGCVTVNEAVAAQKSKVHTGDAVRVEIPAVVEDQARAEPMNLKIVHEDAEVIVIDKPAGLIVHPGAGNPRGTLMNALLHHCPALFALPRAGIVHRLDKDTSGLLVVAKTEAARLALIEDLKARRVGRIYRAVCVGRLVAGGCIDAPIGRHPRSRLKMAVVGSGRPAVTNYRVVERFRSHTHVEVSLQTGRTHQIRVHMAHVGHPLVGDALYGGKSRIPGGSDEALREAVGRFDRQALHAHRLTFVHPRAGKEMAFDSDLPGDFMALVDAIREAEKKAAREGPLDEAP